MKVKLANLFKFQLIFSNYCTFEIIHFYYIHVYCIYMLINYLRLVKLVTIQPYFFIPLSTILTFVKIYFCNNIFICIYNFFKKYIS